MSVRQPIQTGVAIGGFLSLAFTLGCGHETTAPPATLSIQLAPTNGGDQQIGTVDAKLPQPLRVLVRRGAAAAPGVNVSWTAIQGSLSASSTMTDVSGITSVTWTLGRAVGPQSASASISQTGQTKDSIVAARFTAVAEPGAGSRLRFSVNPTNTFSGRRITPAVQVSELDAFDNPTGSAATITVALGAQSGTGVLSGTTTVGAVAGVATFADLSIDLAGTGYTLSASAAGLSGSTSAAFDVVRPSPGRIAFQSYRDGNAEIYSMNGDGSGVVRLTNDPATDFEPAWSPDGEKIAFVSFRAGRPQIYTMKGDGLGVTALSDSSFYPAWSHDGARIAGSRGTRVCGYRQCVVGNLRIMVMKSDGTGLAVFASGNSPTWSPDGRIAFANGDIYVVNGDGSGLIDLTNDLAALEVYPAWSPDGTKVAFVSNRGGAYDLYVMNADGTSVAQLTHDQATEGRPAWSPDGTRIAFASDKGGDAEIYVMNADGSNVVRLTNSAGPDGWPAWAP